MKFLTLIITAVTIAIASAGQTSPPQAGAAQSTPPRGGAGRGIPVGGTGFKGLTLQTGAAEPLPFVTLTLSPIDESPYGPFHVESNDQGRFTFQGVPAGRYRFAADREGFLHQDRYRAGLSSPEESILTITAGRAIEDLLVAMTPWPAMSGVAWGADGKRLAGVTIQALKIQYTPQGRKLVRTATAISHEEGEYRLFHLTPGYYEISASYSDQSLRPWKSTLTLTPNLPAQDDGYSTVYYPSALTIADAKYVDMTGARDAANVDIVFRETEYFKLTVQLLTPKVPIKPLLNTRVALLPLGADIGTAQDYRIKGSGTTFTQDRLAQGDYVLVALADVQDPSGDLYTRIVSDTRPVRVIEDTDVKIDVIEPFDIPGIVNTDYNTVLPKGMKVQLARVDAAASQTISADIDDRGRFNLPDIGPGIYDVSLKGMPRMSFVRDAGFFNMNPQLAQIRVDSSQPPRVLVRSNDPNDYPRLRSTPSITISLGTASAATTGRVVDGNGKAFVGAQVVLVPTGELRSRQDRYFVTASDGSGAFQFEGVAPGSYTAYAFQKIEAEIYFDPDFNVQISPRGTPVTVSVNSRNPVAITVITTDDLARIVR